MFLKLPTKGIKMINLFYYLIKIIMLTLKIFLLKMLNLHYNLNDKVFFGKSFHYFFSLCYIFSFLKKPCI